MLLVLEKYSVWLLSSERFVLMYSTKLPTSLRHAFRYILHFAIESVAECLTRNLPIKLLSFRHRQGKEAVQVSGP